MTVAQRIAAGLTAAGAAAVAAGVGWIYPPAGAITAGLELLGAGYLTAYFAAKRSTR